MCAVTNPTFYGAEQVLDIRARKVSPLFRRITLVESLFDVRTIISLQQ